MDIEQIVTDQVVEEFQENGAVILRNVLSPAWLALADEGIQRVLMNPGPGTRKVHGDTPGAYVSDYCSYDVTPEYQRLLKYSPLADVMQRVLRSRNIWLLFDQIFVKEGGYSRRTFWHQDTQYLVADGHQLASAWFSLEPLSEAETLEFIPGTHRGQKYAGSAVALNPADSDDTAPYAGGDNLPPLPNIEAEREKWPIVSWASNPGDVLILHPGVLHGGGEMREGGKRRTMTIRMFGDDATYAQRARPSPPFHGISEQLEPGDPLRHPYFPQLRPAS